VSPLEERLQRSLAEFYAMLDCMHFTGATQVVEVQQLKILINRYPGPAQFFLANRSGESTLPGRDAGSESGAQEL
jgi:hypothetical protein